MRINKYTRLIALWLVLMQTLWGAEYVGQVKFNGLPLPGATITATQGDKKLSAVADPNGNYRFADIPDGAWQFQVEMLGFTPIRQDVTTGNGLPGPSFELKMLPLDQIETVAAPPPPTTVVGPASTIGAPATPEAPTQTTSAAPPPTPSIASAAKPAAPAKGKAGAAGASGKAAPTSFQRTDLAGNGSAAPADSTPPPEVTAELKSSAADAGLINGSANNGAASPFAQSPAFGNARRGGRSLYNGNFSLLGYDNSALDARQFSLAGLNTLKPSTSRTNASVTFGGPLKIPHLVEVRNQVNFNVSYQRLRFSNGSVQTTLMPDNLERGGNFAQELNALSQPVQIFDPTSGLPFTGNQIPASRISPQAQSLLQFYPLPNFGGSNRQNYQIPTVSNTHSDSLRVGMNKSFFRKNSINGIFAIQDTRSDNDSVFNFLDLNKSLGQQTTLNYSRSYTARFRGTLTYQFSRQSSQAYPFFSGKENIEGLAGITGVNQVPLYWGPPSLSFSSQIASLSDGNPSINHSQTSATTYNSTWNHNRHNVTFGGNFQFADNNSISQSNPRGGFSFSGASTEQYLANGVTATQFTPGAVPVTGTGSDFAGFLLGIPDASRIAYGNADKYFRSHSAFLFVDDDWRLAPGFTFHWGMRWEYGSPVTEKYDRLVNLNVAPGFATATPILGSNPNGTYPNSLVKPYKKELEPSAAFSWRPFPASSMVVRGSYGIRYNTQVYSQFANRMSQQSPLSTSLSVSDSAAAPLTLANGFYAPPNVLTNTFALDPNFKVGYAQAWNLSIQRDLPGSLVMIATYTGIKGTHLLQAFVPNSYPTGATPPCPTCASSYIYYTSGGNSQHEEGRMELRRRLHNGFTAQMTYTYGKSVDDAASMGGGLGTPAQNWLNLNGERGLSSNDQRHAASFQLQYTSGIGIGGGGLLSGWRGKVAKDWTFVDAINLGTGLPLNPNYPSLVAGCSLCVVRPDYTGQSLYTAPSGLFLNPFAVTAPAAGQWGNAGRDSITGPSQFSMNGSMTRSFKLNDRFNLQATFSATNPLNHPVVNSWGSTVGPQFGLPLSVNGMRSVQTTLRLSF